MRPRTSTRRRTSYCMLIFEDCRVLVPWRIMHLYAVIQGHKAEPPLRSIPSVIHPMGVSQTIGMARYGYAGVAVFSVGPCFGRPRVTFTRQGDSTPLLARKLLATYTCICLLIDQPQLVNVSVPLIILLRFVQPKNARRTATTFFASCHHHGACRAVTCWKLSTIKAKPGRASF